MTTTTLVLAHQGGWDEVLLVLTPIGIFAALLFLANRRADKEVRRRAAARPTPGPDDAPDGSGPDDEPG